MNRDERRLIAERHNEYMKDNFANESFKSKKLSVIYNTGKIFNTKSGKTNCTIIVEDLNSQAAVLKYSNNDSLAVLNFASFTKPGGGFINGSMAQEEALCHSSNLYNILREFNDVYQANYETSTRQNQGLYMDWGIFTPDVVFIYNEGTSYENTVEADVISVPCPNHRRWMDNGNKNTDLFNSVLLDRIKFVLNIAEEHNIKTLILGAYGCGVFGNDPYIVASYFKKCLNENRYSFDKVVFAIPKGKDNNLEIFKKVWK